MKKVILLLPLLVSFYFISCDDSFNPYAPFTEDYVLNGIVRGDTSYQVVTLTHSYQPKSTDPLAYKNDPAIAGTKIELSYDNKIYVLRDSSIMRTDTSHFDTPFRFYYTNDLRPDVNKTISIKAVLPNGKVLKAETHTPNVNAYGSGFFDNNSDYTFPPDTGTKSYVSWQDIGNYVYAPDININYQVTGDSSFYKIAVPVGFNGDGKPDYAKPTRDDFLSFDIDAVQKTLYELASEYGSKSKLKIINITVDIQIYDEYLSLYYSSIRLGLDNFTIRIDNPDYSNIKGGYGIFGCYVRTVHRISFRSAYLKNLGF